MAKGAFQGKGGVVLSATGGRAPMAARSPLIILVFGLSLSMACTPSGGLHPKALARPSSSSSATSLQMSGSPGVINFRREGLTVVLSWEPLDVGGDYVVSRDGETLTTSQQLTYTDENPLIGEHEYSVVGVDGTDVQVMGDPVSVAIPSMPVWSARITGKLKMGYRVMDSSFPGVDTGHRDENWAWTFTPTCASGACPVRASAKVDGSLRPLLVPDEQEYQGTARTLHWFCRAHGARIPSVVTLRLRSSRAAIVNGIWTATRVVGHLVVSFPSSSGCNSLVFDRIWGTPYPS